MLLKPKDLARNRLLSNGEGEDYFDSVEIFANLKKQHLIFKLFPGLNAEC